MPPTPLIGRDRDVAEVVTRLQLPNVRLLTLVGPGGIGKTRLAVEAARELHHSFPDGVHFVPLAPLAEPGLVAGAIAQVVGVREEALQPLADRLMDRMGYKQLLLVLDNFEHVRDAWPLVSNMLATCPNLKLLVTSRSHLHVHGEHVFPVAPLMVPDPLRLPSLAPRSRMQGRWRSSSSVSPPSGPTSP